MTVKRSFSKAVPYFCRVKKTKDVTCNIFRCGEAPLPPPPSFPPPLAGALICLYFLLILFFQALAIVKGQPHHAMVDLQSNEKHVFRRAYDDYCCRPVELQQLSMYNFYSWFEKRKLGVKDVDGRDEEVATSGDIDDGKLV